MLTLTNCGCPSAESIGCPNGLPEQDRFPGSRRGSCQGTGSLTRTRIDSGIFNPISTTKAIELASNQRSFFFQAEDGIRDDLVTGVQTCALPISESDCWAVHTPGQDEQWLP